MSDFIEIVLDDGTPVLFQTAESDLVRNHSGGVKIEKTTSAASRLQAIAMATEKISKSLRAKLAPDEFTMEIGVGLSGEVGWFFAKSDAEASIKATITWKTRGEH